MTKSNGSIKQIALSDPVNHLKNVGPKRAELFQKIGIRSVGDLLEYYPRKYQDRRQIEKISELKLNQYQTIIGLILKFEEMRPGKKMVVTKALIKDDSGTLQLVWFNQPYIKNQLKQGQKIIVHGKIEQKYLVPEMIVQEYETWEKGDSLAGGRMIPVYGTTETLSQKTLRKIIYDAVSQYSALVKEILPDYLVEKYHLMEKPEAVRKIHFPDSLEEQKAARYRLAFEELFLYQLGIWKNSKKKNKQGISHSKDKNILTIFEQKLPFPLTGAQKRVIEEVYQDMEAKEPMARLVQGDVGSGKTAVAAAALYKAAVSGYQGAIMVPTEILAFQHYQSLCSLMGKFGIEVGCLTGSTPAKDRVRLYQGILRGEINVVVGTHSLIQEDVVFKSLSLAITDEQHRFGVVQREYFKNKGFYPDILVMSATPIPRSLALTFYGDLNLSVIDEMPPGRKIVKTYVVRNDWEKRILAFLRKEMIQGRQVYIVCPLVEESERIDLHAASDLAQRLSREDFPEFNIALLHGRMKQQEKDRVMEEFRQGQVHLIVSTTVIEVGINVPNANVMLIRDAERFGLAQLHQLRGRVGRGGSQSYCILMHNAKTKEAVTRMKIMENTYDGFKIAEADLNLRGPGEIFGTRQHGIPKLKFFDVLEDASLVEIIRREAKKIIDDDPMLESLAYRQLGLFVKEDWFPKA